MKHLLLLLAIFVTGCSAIQPATQASPNQDPASEPETMTTQKPAAVSAPRLEDGPALSWEFATTDINGTTIEYATLLPPDFDPAAEYPLLLALPPGGQDKSMVNAGIDTFWQRGALYGFVVVSPVKPSDTNYRSEGSLLLPDFVAFLHETYNMVGGKPHLSGVSNGGISTFKAGLERPDLYQSLTVVPGYAAADADLTGLRELKISLFVGETDGGWVNNSQRTYDALLAAGHSDSYLEILTGEGHLIQSLAGNGVGRIFERLLE